MNHPVLYTMYIHTILRFNKQWKIGKGIIIEIYVLYLYGNVFCNFDDGSSYWTKEVKNGRIEDKTRKYIFLIIEKKTSSTDYLILFIIFTINNLIHSNEHINNINVKKIKNKSHDQIFLICKRWALAHVPTVIYKYKHFKEFYFI